ncbi:hypothetical protein PLICRDRAFT_173371 [Plicaturopsis crispa FD-325 SS-3]|nr:hypothetical protein PLICRDRAFT_173371 [Plicaturopsis crispa FD-325 SS-3]
MAPSIPLLFLSAGATILLFGVYRVSRFFWRNYTSPLRELQGPLSTSIVHGAFKDVQGPFDGAIYEKWVEKYGSTFHVPSFLGMSRLYTTDTKALGHILTHTDDWEKPASIRAHLAPIVGTGILLVEGEQHKLQRKILNPAFGPNQIRALTEIFVDKSIQLRDLWASLVDEQQAEDKEKPARIDILAGMSRMTLDVIGLAGFNYTFDSLSARRNELNEAFSALFRGQSLGLLFILQLWIPILRLIPTHHKRVVAEAQKTMGRIGRELLASAKAALISSQKDGLSQSQSQTGARDVLSLLVRANVEEGAGNRAVMTDEDVLAQVPTFLVAGHETTSSAVTWALHELSRSPDVQAKLRAELRSVSSEAPDMDELNALPYLEKVVRECLRVRSPVASVARVAVRDDFIPVSAPFVDRAGVLREGIRVTKGDPVFIPIVAINHSKELWGEDALDFNPDRWDDLPEAVRTIPGPWAHQLTFLTGSRACIGYRFALVEMKALLFILVRAFEFEEAVPSADVCIKPAFVQRPSLFSESEKGSQLPLLIRPAREE